MLLRLGLLPRKILGDLCERVVVLQARPWGLLAMLPAPRLTPPLQQLFVAEARISATIASCCCAERQGKLNGVRRVGGMGRSDSERKISMMRLEWEGGGGRPDPEARREEDSCQ